MMESAAGMLSSFSKAEGLANPFVFAGLIMFINRPLFVSTCEIIEAKSKIGQSLKINAWSTDLRADDPRNGPELIPQFSTER